MFQFAELFKIGNWQYHDDDNLSCSRSKFQTVYNIFGCNFIISGKLDMDVNDIVICNFNKKALFWERLSWLSTSITRTVYLKMYRLIQFSPP